MKTQLSKASFTPSKRYSSVYQQQGRPLTDADWNELSDIVKERLNDVLRDIIGNGTPQNRGIVTDDGTKLKWGYVYVDGIVAQVRPTPNVVTEELEYDKQADFPNPPNLPAGDYQLYLDVWDRTIISLEDEQLRDPGLHGADTCTRTQTMAQVKWAPLNTGDDPNPENPEQNPPKGTALLTLELRSGSTDPDPCDPCADEVSLQDKVGNYLFRVEVHDVKYDNNGAPAKVTLKWSSENGAEQYEINNEPLGFSSEGWVYDFFHGEAEQFASEKHLGFHLSNDPGWTPARSELTDGYPDTAPSGYSFVRRWDGYCVLELDGTDWKLTSDADGVLGSDRGVALSTTTSSTAHGHVVEGSTVVINLDAIILSLDLGNKKLLAGDFWYVPVRETVHAAGDVLLNQVESNGIIHHYMTLATIEGGTITGYSGEQCKRLEFPPLTDLRADAVCFDNDNCEMPSVNTVQQALDHLCQEKDLSWHHKHLHGWGIVCGLIVECGPDTLINDDTETEHREVTVGAGAALDCNGNIIEIKQPHTFDFIASIDQTQEEGNATLLDDNGNGSVCMSVALDSEGNPTYNLEPYDKADSSWQSLLDGTLLMDFFDDCVLDLIESLREEINLSASEAAAEEAKTGELVGFQRRRMTALLNLIIQFINQDNGSYVFLSEKEHKILEEFYLRLRELLQSKTFCAMSKGDDFPKYPFPDTNMTTLFGKGSHTNLVVHSPSERAYSFAGTDNTINVYDLSSEELINVVEMPAGEGAEVQSVAVSQAGDQIYAVATARGVDTVFGVADISGDEYQWRKVTVLCGLVITKLIASESDPELLYAIGKGTGLYFLRPQILLEETKPEPKPVYSFNAVGHLVIDENTQRAFATANDAEASNEVYNQVVFLNIAKIPNESADTRPPTAVLNLINPTNGEILTGEDDIALGELEASSSRMGRLYVITNDSSNQTLKHLMTYDVNQAMEGGKGKPLATLDLENTTIRLAFHQPTRELLMSMEDGYRVQRVSGDGNTVINFRIPVQISPIAISSDLKNNQVYVLNFVSNTISRVPGKELDVNEQFLDTLAGYRQEILLAFYALLGSLIQYLKDCFCHHLLVKCPTCEDEDKIYLACVEVKAHQVYNVCNFSKRKYVKSFPTVGYWLSLIPIVPMLKWSVEKACCSVLPDLFERYREKVIPPQKAVATSSVVGYNNTIKSERMRSGLQTYQRTDFRAVYRDQTKNFGVYRELSLDSAINRAKTSSIKEAGISKSILVGSSVPEAQAHLKKSGVNVKKVLAYDPNKAAGNLIDYGRTPLRVPQGAEVTLYEKDGKVMFYTMTAETEATIATDDIKAEITALQQEKTTVQADLKILKEEITAVQKQREAIGDIAALREQLTELATMHNDIKLAIAKDRPVKDITGVTPEIDTQLRELGIRSVAELAEVDSKKLTATGVIKPKIANRIITEAKKRLEVR